VENFVEQLSKNFSNIAQVLEKKSTCECVQYYYLTKKSENYKQMCKRPRARPRSKTNAANKPVTGSGKLLVSLNSFISVLIICYSGGQCMAMNIDISSGVTTRQSVASALREQLKPEPMQNNNSNQNRNSSTPHPTGDDMSINSQTPNKEEKHWWVNSASLEVWSTDFCLLLVNQ
jgi:hypothetical protein